ncbi:MAG: WecB/TagA/CpsF family glycosyltransferase [Proteobacteria bacterium]|nr:WecB/TagA/CpsF family glycosyltransferase [Pseudomonadota bacterium]MBI3497932.1 WecB/TagA/CpsF family glycosyltransferase [Pseudomonadota bacterium]
MQAAVRTIRTWVESGRGGYVCIRDAHGVVLSQHDREFKAIHNQAGMVTPDGMPLVWFCWALGYREVSRVYGPDLMAAVIADETLRRKRHFLLGGGPGVAEALASALGKRYPEFQPVGIYAPPPADTEAGIDQRSLEAMRAAGAEIVWVGLGSPKQERWMARHFPHAGAAAMVGVGAAFDFLSGRKPQAPRWMQRSGLEWVFRLASEPGRLAGRYLRTVPVFILLSILALTGLRRFHLDDDKADGSARNP